MKLFLVAAPGLEALVAAEAGGLGEARAVNGGVELEGEREVVWRANLELRLATRVLVRVGEVTARDFAKLRRGVAGLPWERFLRGAGGVEVKASAQRSRLFHTGAIAERVLGGIADRLGAGASDALVMVRAENDVFTFSVDSSGELLHRRGYRVEHGGAPLRETLACAILSLAAWAPGMPLVDPMCGSGTFVIEAALAAAGRPPGAARRFAFEDWPGHDADAWHALRDAPGVAVPTLLRGSDLDAGAVELALANSARAGVAKAAHFAVADAAELELPPGPPGLVVVNPPYGMRLASAGPATYAALGRAVRAAGWRLAMFTPEEAAARAAGRASAVHRLLNGGVRVALYLFQTA